MSGWVGGWVLTLPVFGWFGIPPKCSAMDSRQYETSKQNDERSIIIQIL